MNDLRTLIDLCPGIRLPQNEVEIFSDLALTDYYLCKLCGHNGWYGGTAPDMVYHYAKYVMKSRWIVAEPVIITDPYWAYFYATYVVESRWPEAEAIIATDRITSGWYNDKFGTNI